MRVGRGRCRVRRGAAVLVVAGFAAALAAGPASAGQCDPVMPKREVTAGMVGTGLTVTRGRTPEPFSVEVLGVLPNFAGAGRDVILVDTSGPAIARANGIWYGISGSPVYIGGRLVGALAYGFSSTSTVAGLTPAEDMLRIDSFPTRPARRVTAAATTLPDSLAREVARRTDGRVGEGDAITQLPLPFSVSGLSARRIRHVRAWATKNDLRIVPYAGGTASSSAAAAPGDPLDPGDNFAAVAAYGDATLAAVGTTTYVCNGRALAFGHPFALKGNTHAGANAADALAIISDPLLGPYKMANVAETLGLVDQDRIAGLRAILGAPLGGTAVRTTIMAPETGSFRDGATDVIDPDAVGFASFIHLISNVDSVFDAIRGGTAAFAWTIDGTRADGTPWRLARSDLTVSHGDISFEAASRVAMDVETLASNPFEDVKVTAVRANASVAEAIRQYTVARVLVAKGRGKLRARRAVTVTPGVRLRVRAVLRPFERNGTRVVDFAFRMPRRGMPFGMLEVGGRGGGGAPESEGGPEGVVFGPESGQGVTSFDALLRMLEKTPRSDILTARLRLGERLRPRSEKKVQLDGVVVGNAVVELRPPGGGPGGPEGGPPKEG